MVTTDKSVFVVQLRLEAVLHKNVIAVTTSCVHESDVSRLTAFLMKDS